MPPILSISKKRNDVPESHQFSHKKFFTFSLISFVVQQTPTMKFSLIIIGLFLVHINADAIDSCIQNKLKLPSPISHKTIFDDIANHGTKFRFAARSALQVCHPTFDIVAGQIFGKFSKANPNVTEAEANCYRVELMRKNAGGTFVESFDKNLLNGFEGDENCREIIDSYTNAQIAQKMPNGTPEELQCLSNSLDKYMESRYKAKVLSQGHFESEVVGVEKEIFVKELREVSETLIECLNALEID